MVIPIQEFCSKVFATTSVVLAHPKTPSDLFRLGHTDRVLHLPGLQTRRSEEIDDPR